MQTKEFTDNLLKIIALARENRLALMCAEALPWRCHRSLISDALVVRHVKVEHIISATSLINHQLNEMAHVEGTKITYPLIHQRNAPENARRLWDLTTPINLVPIVFVVCYEEAVALVNMRIKPLAFC